MNRQTSLCLVLVVALASIVLYVTSGYVHGEPATPAATSQDNNDDIFKDKILLIEVNSPNDSDGNSVVLDNARVAKVGGRNFIVGDGYAAEKSDEVWYEDMTVGVPCESISRFQSMTPERFKEYMKMWKDHAAK